MDIQSLFNHCNQVNKVFGTAGAGKTTFLINKLNELFESGVQPEEIGFASFTNKAVDEMVARSIKKFPQFQPKQFKFFKTIHALCNFQLA